MARSLSNFRNPGLQQALQTEKDRRAPSNLLLKVLEEAYGKVGIYWERSYAKLRLAERIKFKPF